MSRILVHLATGPENPTRGALAFLVARTAAAGGHDVSVFLAGDAVAYLRDATLDAAAGIGTGSMREHYAALVELDLQHLDVRVLRARDPHRAVVVVPLLVALALGLVLLNAFFVAAEFATPMCPDVCWSHTGCAADTGSRSPRVGWRCSRSLLSLYPWARIHWPAGVFRTRAPTARTTSAIRAVVLRFTCSRVRPKESTWQCASLNPGTTVAPSRSQRRAPVRARAFISRVVPSAAIRPCTAAIACTPRCAPPGVTTFPFRKIVSGRPAVIDRGLMWNRRGLYHCKPGTEPGRRCMALPSPLQERLPGKSFRWINKGLVVVLEPEQAPPAGRQR